MELLPKDYIILTGVFFTFIATILGYYFTRKNIKTSKYIEVVTAERIKWQSTIRIEISEVVTTMKITLEFYSREIVNIEHQQPSQSTMGDANYEHQRHYFDSLTSNAFQDNEIPKLKDLISQLTLLKLRFNPEDDKVTLNLIDYFIQFYQTKYKSSADINIASEKIDLLIVEIQQMLKNEWEKVKKESKGE